VKVPKKFEFMALSARGWLDELYQDAQHVRAPAQLKNDFATAMRWLGIRNFSEIRQEHYELWSAGFVCYLAEGKAPGKALPSMGLAGSFGSYAKWAREDAPPFVALDDDIRSVFGRLLSADTDIALPGHAPNASESFRRFRIILALAVVIFCLSFWLWYFFEPR
jgi:hypothetical protein